MNRNDVYNILSYLSLNYPSFKLTDELINMWLDELQQYDYEDVMNKIKEMLGAGKYISCPPTLMAIVSGLTKKNKKINWKDRVVMCHICGKAFNVNEKWESKELKDHEDKCRSINYVIKQTKKWLNKDLTRAELWAMDKKEFDIRYDKLLHYIYEHTDNQTEKDIISYIWNPPSAKKVKEMFGITDEE